MLVCVCYTVFVIIMLSHTFYLYFSFFFFFKQKTAYEMRISDWSSDVCSSDLRLTLDRDAAPGDGAGVARPFVADQLQQPLHPVVALAGGEHPRDQQIGRASGRERVCQYV